VDIYMQISSMPVRQGSVILVLVPRDPDHTVTSQAVITTLPPDGAEQE